MQDQYILALDQSSRAMLFDRQGNIVSIAQKEFEQIYPQPGWVEHDPQEIWSTQAGVGVTRTGLNNGDRSPRSAARSRETDRLGSPETRLTTRSSGGIAARPTSAMR